MSDMLINAHDARLSIIGYQPEVKRIYWSALPNKLPTYGQTLDLSGCEIKAIYADGSEAVVTDYCTFSPDTGYTVPNAHTLTITATYTARSGAVCQADETLPIVTLDHIKIIIPDTVPEYITEHCLQGSGNTPAISEYADAFGFEDVYVLAYWAQGGDIVRATKLNIDSVLTSPNCHYDSTFNYLTFRSHNTTNDGITFQRYTNPTDSRSEHYEFFYQLNASYQWGGSTFTDTAYLKCDKLLYHKLIDAPLEYTEGEKITIYSRDTSAWELYFSISGTKPLSYYYYRLDAALTYHLAPDYFFTYDPITHLPNQPYVKKVDHGEGFSQIAGYYAELTFQDGASDFLQIDGMLRIRANFSCADGAITWTYTNRMDQ